MNNVKLTGNTIEYDGYTLYQIKAVNDIECHDVVKGDLGGYIDKSSIITDNGWISDNAKVYNNSIISDNGYAGNNSIVRNYSTITGNGSVKDDNLVTDNSHIQGNATCLQFNPIIYNSIIKDNAQVTHHSIV